MVTSTGPNGPVGLTANAITSLSLDPLLMIVCLDLGSRTLSAVRHSGRLAVNVLGAEQRVLAERFASKAPEHEKFTSVPHEVRAGLPILEGAVAWFAGTVRELVPGGDHVIGVTEIEELDAPGGEPLLYHRGAYTVIGDEELAS